MAENEKITQMTETTTADGADLATTVVDVSTTPANRKITIANLLKQIFLAAGTKLSFTTITDGEFLKRSGTNITSAAAALAGLITGSGLTQATGKLLGRSTASTGAIEEITVGSGLSLSGGTLTSTGTGGTVTTTGSPSSGEIAKFSGATSITGATPASDYVAPGAITTSGLTQATDRLLGRSTSSTGAVEEIAIGGGLSLAGGTLTGTGGGSSVPSTAQGDILYASAADTLTPLNKDTNATRYLSNTGSSNNPAWSQVAIGNGVSGLGTGVATALGVNVGSAGAPVVNGGALGTPSSGVLTNATGLPLTTGVTGDLPFSNLTPASAASKLLGRGSAGGAGDYEEITLGSGLTMSGTTLSAAAANVFAGGQFELYRLIGTNPRGGTTSSDAIGITGITPQQDTVANADDVDGTFIKRNTAASTNSTAGYDWNVASLVCIGFRPQITTKFKTGSSIAVCRVWCGAFSGSPMASDDPTVNALGFRYSTSAGDTNWQAYSNDNSGGGTFTDTGITVSTATLYNFAIKVVSATSVEFYISTDNGATYTLVATHTTDLPAAASLMNFHFFIRTLENVVKFLSQSWAYIRER